MDCEGFLEWLAGHGGSVTFRRDLLFPGLNVKVEVRLRAQCWALTLCCEPGFPLEVVLQRIWDELREAVEKAERRGSC